MDLEETDKGYRVTAELPGLQERDVEVLLRDGMLTVRGERRPSLRTAPIASGSTAASSVRFLSIETSMRVP
jgi:HSP20 family protein